MRYGTFSPISRKLGPSDGNEYQIRNLRQNTHRLKKKDFHDHALKTH